MSRTADISRKTNETDIRLSLSLDGAGDGTRTTLTDAIGPATPSSAPNPLAE